MNNGATYTFTGKYTLPLNSLTLYDAASNEETLENNQGRRVNVLSLSGRTLYKDDSWNTLCLPFDVDDISGTYLSGATVKTLESSDYSKTTHTLTLNFADATSIEAGMPYLVKWPSGADNKLYYPSADMAVGSCRAVFKLNGITAGDLSAAGANIVLNFGDGETTSINEELIMNNEESAGTWYDPLGRKLNNKPSRAGVYINNGKKVIIK